MKQADETFNPELTGMQMAEIAIALGLASLVGIIDPESAQEIIDKFITIVPGLRDQYKQTLAELKEREARSVTVIDTDPDAL